MNSSSQFDNRSGYIDVAKQVENDDYGIMLYSDVGGFLESRHSIAMDTVKKTEPIRTEIAINSQTTSRMSPTKNLRKRSKMQRTKEISEKV